MASPKSDEDRWLRVFQPRPEREIRLVCFPHAGGAATYYFAMSQQLDPRFEVTAVQYPGRQDRRTEPLVDSVPRLADQVADALAAVCEDGPFAFFGHSMGAVLAFEVARRLRDRGQAGPVRMFVSGRRAPSRVREGRVHLRDDQGLLEELRAVGGTDHRVLGDPELLAAVLPVTRNDYRAVETYRWHGGAPLECPVTALVGDADPQTTVQDAEAWAGHTTGAFDLKVFQGGHFYLDAHRAAVCDAVSAALAGSCDDVGAAATALEGSTS
ncbi:thioesterase II family protein [Streptomyces cyanogenus]|uniref:Linear gramicidin dehydrogenase LgrE n=1 Tax=Streptomyces cyanogenus TaxID=80860 RepID=A0ABX7TJD6_STRCY|nr:alpha/beta fold hydrolase [Streptomyces cyanogenus]QTD96701.1 Linear gramicidin dehydrogenase LgrE [Streptomyces cyanogenus]